MTDPEQEKIQENVKEEVQVNKRSWKNRGRLMGVPVSLLAIWAALFLASSAIPALPVPGMSGMITVNAIVTAISGLILGPGAAIANAAGAIVSQILFPYGFSLGPLGFLTVTMGGLVAGLLMANKWKWAALAELLVVAAWFVNPKAWQPFMWAVPLPYTAVTLAVILIKPLREWILRMIATANKKWIWVAVFCVASCGHAAEFLTTNAMTNWMWNLSWQYWVPTLPYWIGVDTVIIALSTVVGALVVIGLRRAHLPQISDNLVEK
jgi:hypothetical protein